MRTSKPGDGIILDGFWTEEELKQQQIFIESATKQPESNNHKDQIQLKVCPPSEIKNKSYSLHPDMATGWVPKTELPSPVPIAFENERLDCLIRNILKLKSGGTTPKICYLGPRQENTYNSWYDKPFAFPYSHIKTPNNLKFTNRPFCGQKQDSKDQLVFDSFFQSGNLDCAIRVGEREYQLFLRVDSNTKGHFHWFNFKVKNLQKFQKYTIHICNFQKDRSLYNRGMKPYIFSQKKYQKTLIGWQQSGQQIRYESKSLKCTQTLSQELPRMYKLSFEYTSEYEKDEIQISYCIPYTYTRLVKFLCRLTQKPESKDIVQMSKLCTSLGGLQVPLLIVHEKQDEEKKESNDLAATTQSHATTSPQKDKQKDKSKGIKTPKKCIIISARAHPGESNGSFMMEGFIDFICGNSKEAQILRRNVVFKIIPMLNPDGVALGNYRTGVSGKDFNRQFRNPDKVIFPEVFSIKKLVAENKNSFKENLAMFLDFHGHSVRKNVFVYGPEFTIIQKLYYETRVFPKLLGNQTQMFRYYSCIFKVSEFKETTARAVVLRKLGVPFTYTIQASNGSYYDCQQLKDIPFQESSWKLMGKAIGQTLHDYVGLLTNAQEIMFKKEMEKKKLRNRETITVRRNFLKTTKARSSRSFFNEPEIHSLILPGIQDQKIKLLFDEIKGAQQKKQKCKVSDDELSQGDSDQQGEADDLSPTKLNFLYKIIKNKTSQKSPQKTHERFMAMSRFMTYQDRQKSTGHENQNDDAEENPQKLIEQTGINRKPTMQQQKRSFIYKNTNKSSLIIQPGPKRQLNGTAMINLNHGVYSRQRGRSMDQRESERERTQKKLNFLEQGSVSTLTQDKKARTGYLRRVLDLSDSFRNTCAQSFKDRDRERAEFTIDTVYQSAQLTRHPRRFQVYKIRRFGSKNPFS